MDIGTPIHVTSSSVKKLLDQPFHAFDALWAQLAMVGVVVSACNAIVYYPLRSGLGTPNLLVPSCFLIVSAALLAPLLLPRRGFLAGPDLRCVAMPLLSLVVLAGVLLAFVLRSYLLPVFGLVALAGLWRAFQLLRTGSRLQLAFCICAGLVIGFYLLCEVQGMNYAGLYSPEQSQLGALNHDTTFHAAIAFIIQNFGVPSAALDGIIPIKYHFGSHYWFAALGRLAGSDPLFSYGAGVPIVLAPMLVVSLLASAAAIDRGAKPLAGYLLVGCGLVLLSDIIGWNSYYISESYSCGLIAMLLLLPLLALVAGGVRLSPRQDAVVVAILVAMIAPLLVLKISVGALWTAALGWVILRRYGLSLRGILAACAAGGIFLASYWMLAPSKNDYSLVSTNLIVPLFFFRIFGVVSLSSLVIPLVLLFSRTRIYGGEGLRAVFAKKSDLMFEAAIVVLICATVPAVLGIPQDSALFYFLNVPQWLAMALLVAQFGLRTNVLARGFPVVIAAACAALMLAPALYKQASAVLNVADKRADGHLLNGGGPAKYFREAIRREHVLWDSRFRDAMAHDAHAQLAQTVRRLVPVPDKALAVFVTPENKAFWSQPSYCLAKYNVQVSLTGQPSLLGGPPASYQCPVDAYTSAYGKNFQSRDMPDGEICAHASQRNMRRVLIIAEDRAGDRGRILDCGLQKEK